MLAFRIPEGEETMELPWAECGLLFHGTGEPLEGPLRPGGDGLLWFARAPSIAQTYIPKAGVSMLLSLPVLGSSEMKSSVRPTYNKDGWHMVAMAMGLPDPEVTWERYLPVSWRIPNGWPTYEEAAHWLQEEMGYPIVPGGSVWVSVPRTPDGKEKLMPAAWRKPGTLIVAKTGEQRFYDLRIGQDVGDLTDPDHLKRDDFEKIEAQGKWDGVIINDFLQSENHGNVPHLSLGFFERALEGLEWTAIPACNYEWEPDEVPGREETTPEWRHWAMKPNGQRLHEFLGGNIRAPNRP